MAFTKYARPVNLATWIKVVSIIPCKHNRNSSSGLPEEAFNHVHGALVANFGIVLKQKDLWLKSFSVYHKPCVGISRYAMRDGLRSLIAGIL